MFSQEDLVLKIILSLISIEKCQFTAAKHKDIVKDRVGLNGTTTSTLPLLRYTTIIVAQFVMCSCLTSSICCDWRIAQGIFLLNY